MEQPPSAAAVPQDNFAVCAGIVLDAEGGFVNDGRDSGGETCWGISRRAFPNEDIANLSKERALQLYRQHYWDAIKADHLPGPVALVLFDCAINQGVSAAATILQEALGVKPDGVIGPLTIAAAIQHQQAPASLVVDLCAKRALRYAQNAQLNVYGFGWYRRLFRVASAALM